MNFIRLNQICFTACDSWAFATCVSLTAVVAHSKKGIEINHINYIDDCIFCILENKITFCVFWRPVLPCALHKGELGTWKPKWRDNWLISVMLPSENFLYMYLKLHFNLLNTESLNCYCLNFLCSFNWPVGFALTAFCHCHCLFPCV